MRHVQRQVRPHGGCPHDPTWAAYLVARSGITLGTDSLRNPAGSDLILPSSVTGVAVVAAHEHRRWEVAHARPPRVGVCSDSAGRGLRYVWLP